ncbi:MAG: DUF4445 domain-containing protein [Methanomicrobiales archaeon]|nr:DUF4445 domain-containing protein [Methanomicrobiales archaeon]
MNRMVTVRAGITVLDAIREAGIQFEAICGGKGNCGKCKVIRISGDISGDDSICVKFLTLDEQRKGYCLACMVRVWSDAEFTIPVESRIDNPQILLDISKIIVKPDPSVKKFLVEKEISAYSSFLGPSIKFSGYNGIRPFINDEQKKNILHSSGPLTATIVFSEDTSHVLNLEEGDTTPALYGIAIDLGTTTVVGILADLISGEILGVASTLNRQITLGEELVTRIAIGRKETGQKNLQSAAIASINDVIYKLTRIADISDQDISDICLAGNTVMTWLFAGRNPEPLEYVDTKIPKDPILVHAGECGIGVNSSISIYCLPAVSRFIGGDVIGDVLTSGMHIRPKVSLLVDLGTNGEIILGNNDWLVSTSCASGPAFEGAGMRCGMRAMRGAIDQVTIETNGTVHIHVIGETLPKGICGSGIIEAAAAMASAGILDFSGKLVDNAPGVRTGENGLEYILVPAEKTAIGRDIVITRDDMAYLMDSKAAALAAIHVLMKKYRIGPDDITDVFLAGALGTYGSVYHLTSFGILPQLPNAKFHRIGNGSLAGAYACLLSVAQRKNSVKIAEHMGYIDLMVDNDFIEEYWKALRLPEIENYSNS